MVTVTMGKPTDKHVLIGVIVIKYLASVHLLLTFRAIDADPCSLPDVAIKVYTPSCSVITGSKVILCLSAESVRKLLLVMFIGVPRPWD